MSAEAASPAARFDALVEDYCRAWMRFHPEAAVAAGRFEHAGRLRPVGDDDIGALVALDEGLLAALDELDPEGLDPDRALDHAVLRGAAAVEHHELLALDWRRRDPVAFLPLEALHQLVLLPVPAAGCALAERLAAVPALLRAARAHLGAEPERVPALWAEAAAEEARAGVAFVRALPVSPAARGAPAGVLRERAEAAARALEAYAAWLEDELAPRAAGPVACGADHYGRLLHHRHALPVGAAALRRFGEALAAATRRALAEACRRLRGDTDVTAALAALEADHPPREALLEAYRRLLEQARAFVLERGLVSAPPAEHLEVRPTPEFLRGRIPFAAYVEPLPDDPAQRGVWYVTVPEDEDGLRAHARTAMGLTCVHEAWPGHHLQFVTAHTRPAARSLPRLLFPSATFYEGWALYCEGLMREQGFLAGPGHELMLLRDRLWRALRVVLDVDLQTGAAEPEEAARRLTGELGIAPAAARAEIIWYTRAPAVPMSYASGWALIAAAREATGAAGDGRGLRDFHDRLLACGPVPVLRALERAFGDGVARAAAASVFGAAAAAP